MKGTWQTTSGSGGPGGIIALAAIAGAVYVAAKVAPAATAIGQGIAHALIIIAATLATLTVAAVTAGVVYHHRHRRRATPPGLYTAKVIPPSTGRAIDPPATKPPMAALPPGRAPAELHLHFHDMDAAQVAEAIRQAQQ